MIDGLLLGHLFWFTPTLMSVPGHSVFTQKIPIAPGIPWLSWFPWRLSGLNGVLYHLIHNLSNGGTSIIDDMSQKRALGPKSPNNPLSCCSPIVLNLGSSKQLSSSKQVFVLQRNFLHMIIIYNDKAAFFSPSLLPTLSLPLLVRHLSMHIFFPLSFYSNLHGQI